MVNTYTITDLSKHFGVPWWRIDYAMRTREIPHDRVGPARVWTADQLPAIEQALIDTGAIPRATATQV